MPSSFDADQLRRDHPLSEYLPARGIAVKPEGREFRCLCPFHAERTPSFQIYQGRKGTQEFHCKGCDAKGDVIQFVERYDGATFAEACEILGGTREPNESRAPFAPAEPPVDIYAAWKPRVPDASTPPIIAGKRTPPLANPKSDDRPVTHYTPTAVYPYHHSDGRVIGYVLRVEIKGRKITPLILWCENTETGELMWCHRPFAAPRRLYNLPAFAARPDAQVLVVEGEKCADAAQALLPRLVVTTWQGGGKAAGKSNWKPVSGRDVLIWPDADPEGLTAAHEAGRLATEAGARSVRVISIPADKPKGWDVADAIEDGWTKADVVAFARAGARPWGETTEIPQTAPEPPAADERRFDEPPAGRDGERERLTRPALRPVAQEKPQPDPESKPGPKRKPPLAIVGGTDVPDFKIRHQSDEDRGWWKDFEIDENNRIKKKLYSNLLVALSKCPDLVGALQKNNFSSSIDILRRPPWDSRYPQWEPRALSDYDIRSARAWLDQFGIDATEANIESAISKIADDNAIDPARDYFDGLKWDGEFRLDTWMEDYCGVKRSATGIERVFAAKTLIAAAARNTHIRPEGVQVDTMLILEGDQGAGKSQLVKTLGTFDGNQWVTSAIPDIRNKDAILQMCGNVLVEMDELEPLQHAGMAKVKSFITTQRDDIRPPYGKGIVRIPRRFVLIGSMNPDGQGYLPDPSGARRFWPVRVHGPIDLEGIAHVRDQLWAEARARLDAGETWWLDAEQEAHARIEQAARFKRDPFADDLDEWMNTIEPGNAVPVKAAFQFLGFSMAQRKPDDQRRIVSHLKQAGWTAETDRSGEFARHVFRKPRR